MLTLCALQMLDLLLLLLLLLIVIIIKIFVVLCGRKFRGSVNKMCGMPPQYAPPSVTLTFEVVSDVQSTLGRIWRPKPCF